MIKRTVTYEDFAGNPVTEDLYFNMYETELVEFQNRFPGGFEAELERITAGLDGETIDKAREEQIEKDLWDFVTTFLQISYGRKTEDNRAFLKSEETTKYFTQSLAYTALIKSFKSASELLEFIIGVFPADVKNAPETQKAMAAMKLSTVPPPPSSPTLPPPTAA